MTTQGQVELETLDEIFDQYYERNLTDGLPIIHLPKRASRPCFRP